MNTPKENDSKAGMTFKAAEAALANGEPVVYLDPESPEGKSTLHEIMRKIENGEAVEVSTVSGGKVTVGLPGAFKPSGEFTESEETRRRLDYEVDKAQREYAGQKKTPCGLWECTRCGKDVSPVTHRCECTQSPSPWVPKGLAEAKREFDQWCEATDPAFAFEEKDGQTIMVPKSPCIPDACTCPPGIIEPGKGKVCRKPTHQILGVDVQGNTAKVSIPDWVEAQNRERFQNDLESYFTAVAVGQEQERRKRRIRRALYALAFLAGAAIARFTI